MPSDVTVDIAHFEDITIDIDGKNTSISIDDNRYLIMIWSILEEPAANFCGWLQQ